jgi:dihydroorotate dehydrogenase subfamily 2
MQIYLARAVGFLYRHIAAPIFFLWDSEPIHDFFLNAGEWLAKVPGVTRLTTALLRVHHPALATTVAGITFENPVGLAAGFDHEGQLPGIIGSIGFGFESVGTVTNKPYEGNPYPRIKRLVKSRAILVNKGFKSTGITNVLARMQAAHVRAPWHVPVGISLGRTNTLDHTTHADAIRDVCEAFAEVQKNPLPFAYYELNISCPNLRTDISFYTPEPFAALLTALHVPRLGKPLFVKMPIGLSESATTALLDVCMQFGVAAVIFGNLQHDRTHHTFDKAEVAEHANHKGNWSGMPCQDASDAMVHLAYRHTKGALPIVGCGGIFTAADAYRKIRNGASLVQLVTATIFEGPQVPAEICASLPALLTRDGFATLADAVGVDARN